ncbi:MAG TPA: ABC transporter ATP-binding protein [Clostridiales bacterium]|nr:ABC transporter ATP-binding protein [Clostridiales bacterium]
MDALRLEHISFSYEEGNPIFEDVNLCLRYGDFVLLSGVSGEGKSTLLSILNGMIPFITPGTLSGKVWMNDQEVTDVKVSERAKLLGTVLQNADEQIVYDEVRDEIAFGCENLDIPVAEIDRRIAASTAQMKLNPDAKTRTLSGGQKQRLITASTLAMQQKIIILDEPLANLDVEGAHVLLKALQHLAEDGYAVLLVEHRLDVVLPYVNKVMWIKDCKVQSSTDKKDITRFEKVIPAESRESDKRHPS